MPFFDFGIVWYFRSHPKSAGGNRGGVSGPNGPAAGKECKGMIIRLEIRLVAESKQRRGPWKTGAMWGGLDGRGYTQS